MCRGEGGGREGEGGKVEGDGGEVEGEGELEDTKKKIASATNQAIQQVRDNAVCTCAKCQYE